MKNFFFILLIALTNLMAELSWAQVQDLNYVLVLETKGRASVSVPFTDNKLAIMSGDLIPENWQVKGDSASAIKVLCQNGDVRMAYRHEAVFKACQNALPRDSKNIVRFRTEDEFEGIPYLIRPRSEKLLDLFPIVWDFKPQRGGDYVDLYLVCSKSGERLKLASGMQGGKISQLKNKVSLPREPFYIDICRAGSNKSCFSSVMREQVFVIQMVEGSAAKTDMGKTQHDLDETYVKAVNLYYQAFFDDAKDVLDRKHNSDNAQILFLQAQLNINLKLWHLAEKEIRLGLAKVKSSTTNHYLPQAFCAQLKLLDSANALNADKPSVCL